ncbi:MAG: hypothetical protein NTZ09_13995 [Candidatus Hydrogenedentes bacterium]|nr:hypothetical protein [Candidatus Hydrogenedentota bacterium]
MKTILHRMRLERRITLIILAVLMAVAFMYSLFSWSGEGSVTYMIDPADAGSGPAQGVDE